MIDVTARAELMPKSLKPCDFKEDRFEVMQAEYQKLYSEFIVN
jgi:hypothetical protein